VRHAALNLNQFLADRGQHPASSVRDHHHVLDSNAALTRLALARSLAWPASLAALAWDVALAALATGGHHRSELAGHEKQIPSDSPNFVIEA
jgi:hypothetical protein